MKVQETTSHHADIDEKIIESNSVGHLKLKILLKKSSAKKDNSANNKTM